MNRFYNDKFVNFEYDYFLYRLNIPRARLTDTNDVPNEYNRIKSS